MLSRQMAHSFTGYFIRTLNARLKIVEIIEFFSPLSAACAAISLIIRNSSQFVNKSHENPKGTRRILPAPDPKVPPVYGRFSLFFIRWVDRK
jgi:hypothetical protein